MDVQAAARFARLALDCVQREYPNKIAHALNSDADVRPPRELTPAFYGCYDWHSAVHGHWLLARLTRLFPEAPFAAEVRAALARNLTAKNLRREAEYLSDPGRSSFERPYGLAWLLQLAAELPSPAMRPLEGAVVDRVSEWLPKLVHPVRSGEHSQSAFSLGLMLDYARAVGNAEFRELLEVKIRGFYLADRNGPLDYEPSGEDFCSPCLAEADAVRRVLEPAAFAEWLARFLPGIPNDGSTGWLRPARVADPTDGKLAHLDGLNLSRAWMLRGIGRALPVDDARIASMRDSAEEHAAAGLSAVSSERYEGAHWLGTFAVYLLTH